MDLVQYRGFTSVGFFSYLGVLTIPKSSMDCAVAIIASLAECGCQPNILTALALLVSAKSANVSRFVALSIPDIYQEVSGPFQQWYRNNTGLVWQGELPKSAEIVENSTLDYVLLRVTWLYNEKGNANIEISHKGEPFVDAQITREAVAQFVTDLLIDKADYHRESLGVGEQGTNWTKPSFY